MVFVFMDESGSVYSSYQTFHQGYEQALAQAKETGENFPRYPFFILAAMGVPESHLAVVDDWFRQVKRVYLGPRGGEIDRAYELKGSTLYSLRLGKNPTSWMSTGKVRPHIETQKKVWAALSASQLASLEASVFDLLQRLAPTLWVVVVKQAGVYRKYKTRTWHPFYWALTFLQQRVAHHIQARHGSYERALFMMDESSTLKTASHFDRFLATRASINATASWPVDFSRYIIDVPVWGCSHLHEPIQLVDFVAHAVYRHVRSDDSLGWFPRIEPYLARHFSTGSAAHAGLSYIG